MWVAVVLSIFSYLSVEMIAVAAGEAERPVESVKKAFRATLGILQRVAPETRFDKLAKAGLGDLCEEMLAGLKVLRVYADAAQRDSILKLFPTAKFDSATTKSIELLPKDVMANVEVVTGDIQDPLAGI